MDFRLKHLLKRNPLITRIGYYYRGKRTGHSIQRYRSIPTDAKKVLFATTEGRFNDSCRAIAEYLHAFDPSIKMSWAYRNPDFVSEIPGYIKPVRFESKEYFRELATGAVWVFNFLIPQGTIKRKDQLYVQVWHGDKPFKKIANQAAKDSRLYRNRTKGRVISENELCDYFMTGSRLFIDIWRESVGYTGKVISSGLPRNDVLLQDHKERARAARKGLGISDDVMVLLYAPTFRDHKLDNGSIGTDIDLNAVLSILEKKNNRKWVCLKRAHGGKSITLTNTESSDRIIDVTNYQDMTDLLLISDCLITDYSSCAGDFAYLNRPVLLYQDDFETYTTLDRKLIFDIERTPFFRAHSITELESLINKLTEESVRRNCKEILDLYESSQTDHSAKDIVQIIRDHMASVDCENKQGIGV